MNEKIIGIDLGTTNSEVAIVMNGQVDVLEIQNGSRLLPSVVGLADDGSMLVGEAAANQLALYPERTVKSIKRHMGSNHLVEMGKESYTPQEISAFILKQLKQVAEKYLGEPIKKAVITVPAFFSDAQRQATRDAGEIAGLDVARIINEPTAAALAYESNHEGKKNILVYDLGGGTFDVSIVRLENDIVEVLASHGDNRLGGDDFDQKIIDHVVQHLKDEHSIDEKLLTPPIMARIRRAAEAAKIHLSNNPFAMLEEEYLITENEKVTHLSLELSRHDYEEMIAPFIDQTLQSAHTALTGANLAVSDLDEILLVGGATRTPLVSQRLEDEVGLPTRKEIDPDLCVASGAAIQGAVISGEKVDSVLVDITPYTFGTSALGSLGGEFYAHVFVPIIHKNTAIPSCSSEVFNTSHDDQKVVEITVYQGEDKDALNNTEIGQFLLEELSKAPQGNEIICTFNLDLNGILAVTAIEKKTGKKVSITIDHAMASFDDEEMQQAQARIGKLLSSDSLEVAEQTNSNSDNQASQDLIEKAENLMKNANEDDREDLVESVERLKDALVQGDNIEEATTSLSDLIFYMEA